MDTTCAPSIFEMLFTRTPGKKKVIWTVVKAKKKFPLHQKIKEIPSFNPLSLCVLLRKKRDRQGVVIESIHTWIQHRKMRRRRFCFSAVLMLLAMTLTLACALEDANLAGQILLSRLNWSPSLPLSLTRSLSQESPRQRQRVSSSRAPYVLANLPLSE